MRHLVFINGPWQAITAFASLAEAGIPDGDTDLVLIDQNEDIPAFGVTRRLVEVLHGRKPLAVLGAIDRWEDVRDLQQLCADYAKSHSRPTLWLNSFHRIYARYVCEVFSDSRICLYEDGGRNYVDAGCMTGLRALRGRFCWPGDSSWRCGQTWLPQRLRRIEKGYLILEYDLGCPNYLKGRSIGVGVRVLKAVLDRAETAVPEEVAMAAAGNELGGRPFLLAGQNLSRGGNIGWEDELALYERAARYIMERGYVPVWKDHPRNELPFNETLQSRVQGLQCFPDALLRAWPLEIIFRQFHFCGCASIMSSSLFYLKRIGGLPCYTFAHWAIDRLKEPYASQAGLFIDRARPIEQL